MPTPPENFAERLVAGLPDAIIHANAEGNIQVWNHGAERIFGFTAAEALGQSLDVIIPPGLRDRHWTGFHATMSTGQSRYGAGDLLSVPALRKDGTRISVEFTIVPFKNPTGQIEGICAILRDVTARFEEARALKRELAALKGPHP
jgi:PAS domain S-box-containing protein